MDERTSGEPSSAKPPQPAVPTLPPDKLGSAAEAAQMGAVVANGLVRLSEHAVRAGLPSPEDCGLALDYETMDSVAFVLAAWAGALLEAAGHAGSPRVSRPGDATQAFASGLHLPAGGLLLPPGARSPDRQKMHRGGANGSGRKAAPPEIPQE